MTGAQIEIQIIASFVAIACAIPGTFLVLRKMALISDAISHSILPGIVVGYMLTEGESSPWIILLAALSGVLTVVLVEYIQKTGLVKKDTAIGLVFPTLFSIGVILIAQNANDVHIDIDMVLLGELGYAPLNRWIVNGVDLGPISMWIIGSILVVNLSLLIMFFKELKISTFDVGLSASLGFSPFVIHYGLMTMASFTTVGAFDAVGAILVVAFMIAPAATAYLLTKDLKKMLIYASSFGVFASIAGYWFAYLYDLSISGSITTFLGFLFLMVYLFAPNSGVIAVNYRQRRQRLEVSLLTFLLHINNHNEEYERHVNHLNEHINWHKVKSKKVVALALENNLIVIENNIISLTIKGTKFTTEAIDFIVNDENTGIEHMKDRFFLFRG